MKRRSFLAAGATAALAGVAGCTGSGDTGMQDTTTTTQGGGGGGSGGGGGGTNAATVEMVNTSFDPVRLSVQPGTTVTWVNKDSFPHNVVSTTFHQVADSWSFESGTISAGGSASHTFDSAGIYEYYCSIHGKSTMCGVVLVGDVSLDKSLPCTSDGGDGGAY